MTDLLAVLRAKRDHYNETEGDGMEDMLQALDAFLDQSLPVQPPGSESMEAAVPLEKAADALMEAAKALARADGVLALEGRLSEAAAAQNASDKARAASKAARRALAPDARPEEKK